MGNKDEKKDKALKVADKTGEVVGKGIMKSLKITKSLGEGLIRGFKGKKNEEEKEEEN